jgi:hypothetical protein
VALAGLLAAFMAAGHRDRPVTAPAGSPLRFDITAAPHTTRITGVGGTGVVTLSQVLSTAGRIADRQVRSLDQTGLVAPDGEELPGAGRMRHFSPHSPCSVVPVSQLALPCCRLTRLTWFRDKRQRGRGSQTAQAAGPLAADGGHRDTETK